MKPTWQTQLKQNHQSIKFAAFNNPIVLHIVIFNMNATFKIVARIITGLINTLVIIDPESSTKALLRIEESIYTEMNLKVQ